MTASAVASRRRHDVAAAWLAPIALVGGLGMVVAARWWATRAGLDPLAVGAAFGIALLVLVVLAPSRRVAMRADRHTVRGFTVALIVGFGVGLALIAVTVAVRALGPALGGPGAIPGLGRPAAPFLSWAAITVLVAGAEELLLRGALFDRILAAVGARGAGRRGIVVAVVVTSTVFAVMHVPLYGWHVVPLDLGVGCCLAGLRIVTGGVAAPAAAHAVADLATWWL